jgi:predicted TIM-barrel fold metal-dependent hydrolase
MPTRREILLGALAAGATMRMRTSFAKASQPGTAVNFDVPAGACDCHTHIHGDPETFPYFSGRVYTPETALPEEMAALHRALHIQRVVIVTPSVYGTDNSATLWGMKARGADARGVAVIDEKTTESALDAMHRAGVRGVRINLATGGNNDPALGRKRFQALAERVRRRDWHIQMNTSLAVVTAMKDLFATSPVPVVFDHFANARHDLGVEQPGFADLVDLVRSGKGWVKVSVNGAPLPDYSGFAPLARALIAANPERIVWGSNWPHPHSFSGRKATEVTPLFQVDDALVLSQLPLWAADATTRKKILVDNPARLYGF